MKAQLTTAESMEIQQTTVVEHLTAQSPTAQSAGTLQTMEAEELLALNSGKSWAEALTIMSPAVLITFAPGPMRAFTSVL